MLIKGHSGFGIELVNAVTIRKFANGAGAARLKRQIAKQIQFHNEFETARIRTPAVRHESQSANGFHADMDYVVAKDFVQFLSEADREGLVD
jgi:hypothetical protein